MTIRRLVVKSGAALPRAAPDPAHFTLYARWARRLNAARVEILCGTRVVDQPNPGVIRVESEFGSTDIAWDQLILATGARERFLPFPGWTLPGVMGAGGLQAMVKAGLPIAGKHVVLAGSGPLLLAVAANLSRHGAIIAGILSRRRYSAFFALRPDSSPIPQNCWKARATACGLSPRNIAQVPG